MKTPDYMSYSRYKKKKDESPNKGLWIGITTFFVMLFLFTAIAKMLSPDVDVTIGKDEDIEAKESGLGVKRFIDDRLKMIQMEDDMAGVSKKTEEKKSGALDTEYDEYSSELEEKVVLPKRNKKSLETEEYSQTEEISLEEAPRPNKIKESMPMTSAKPAKVFVGYYNSIEQAKVAQGILLDSGLNITPFIKDLGGTYTLQVGSYTSRDKAVSLANELLRNNFPARVAQE